jgi:hypothetical protein
VNSDDRNNECKRNGRERVSKSGENDRLFKNFMWKACPKIEVASNNRWLNVKQLPQFLIAKPTKGSIVNLAGTFI